MNDKLLESSFGSFVSEKVQDFIETSSGKFVVDEVVKENVEHWYGNFSLQQEFDVNI